jgi:hypothetical protein
VRKRNLVRLRPIVTVMPPSASLRPMGDSLFERGCKHTRFGLPVKPVYDHGVLRRDTYSSPWIAEAEGFLWSAPWCRKTTVLWRFSALVALRDRHVNFCRRRSEAGDYGRYRSVDEISSDTVMVSHISLPDALF